MISADAIQHWIMVSKFFSSDGYKLDDNREPRNRSLTRCPRKYTSSSSAGLGDPSGLSEGLRKYQQYLVSTGFELEGMHVALDTANGTASTSARHILQIPRCSVDRYRRKSDGLNINRRFYPSEALQKSCVNLVLILV